MFRSNSRAVRRALASCLVVLGFVLPGPRPVAAAEDTGTVNIVQVSNPETTQAFNYRFDYVTGYEEFSLDDDGGSDSSLEDTRSFGNVAAGEVEVRQFEPATGWAITRVECNDPDSGTDVYSDKAVIDLDPGEYITCFFTDSRTTGDVNIHQRTNPNDPVAFHFQSTWGSTFTLNDDGSDQDFIWPDMFVEGLQPGTYQLDQLEWAAGPSRASSARIPTTRRPSTSARAACHSTSTPARSSTARSRTRERSRDRPPPAPLPNQVNVTLDMVPNDPVDVGFHFGSVLTFSLDDDADGTLSNGKEYNDMDLGPWPLTADVPAGWRVKDITCTDPDGGSSVDKAAAKAIVDLDDGETVNCTFTLEPIPQPPPPPPTPSCNGLTATIVGMPGATTIRGTAGNDVIVDLDGANRIDGRGGNDTICTGAGNDVSAAARAMT